MTTTVLKKGDKGENVKTLQKALGLTADGIFGTNTETAIKKYQKSKGLTVDGIVGSATLKALGLSSIIESTNSNSSSEPFITKLPISRHISNRNGKSIKYIVIHFTAGSSSKKGKAKDVRDMFQKSSTDASADFCVDDETIVQINPSLTRYYCYAVGDGKGKYGITNSNSISIEMCSTLQKGCTVNAANHSGWSVTDKVVDSTVKLTKYLMSKYNVDSSHVVRHYDTSRKLCPGIIGWNDGGIYDEKTGKPLGKTNNSTEWNNFKKRIS